MKNLIKALLLICLFTFNNAFAQNEKVSDPQQLVMMSFQQSFSSGNNKLTTIIDDLPTAYWKAYAHYYEAVYYKIIGESKQIKTALDAGIEVISTKKSKDSEYLALEGLLIGFKAGVEPSMAAVLGSKSIGKLKKALKEDDQNLRAYLGLAENNYYTPKAYGGWSQTEFLLKKTLQCPDQISSTSETFAPSWGRNRAYYLLVSYYKKEGKTEEAKKYCADGLKLFPQDGELNQLLTSL